LKRSVDTQGGGACPSSGCRPGAVLLGIVMPDGRIAYAPDRIVVDEEFVAIAHEGRAPEQRFRFSAPCMSGACRQWDGSECGLVDRLMREYEAQLGAPRLTDPLPECSIRPECRWYLQRGGAACTVCSVLVTDMGRSDDELPAEVAARRARYSVETPPPNSIP